MRRTAIFFAAAILAGIAMIVAWTWMIDNPAPIYTVPEKQTQTIRDVTWHLDFITEVALDDPSLADSYITDIDGATYILVQYTYSAPEATAICYASLLGDGRDWRSDTVRATSPDILRPCEQATSGIVQLVFTVPPSAVHEVHGVRFTQTGYQVILEGQVH